MKRFAALPLLLLLAATPLFAQPGEKKEPFILLVVPEADTSFTSSATYRLSASTNPGNNVTINDKQYKVYPSGAFAGVLDVAVGENLYAISSTNDSGQTVTKQFLIVRGEPLRTTPDDSLVIEDVMMEPSTDRWLGEGDVLQVQMKGTPGCLASFLNGRPMRELSPSETNGIGGIYRGVFKVGADDTLNEQPIVFRLQKDTVESVSKVSVGQVSFKAREFPMVGITRGERVYLNFGLGDDRLGGAKLSFIAAGIRLAITGKVNGQYRVALTENQEAWIPTELVELQPAGTFLPFSLTGSWSVYGDEKYDYVVLPLNDRLPYASSQETDPTRIHIDLFGAVSNSNWITQQQSTREIKNVYYNQVGKQQLRITIELNHRQVWGYEISYRGNGLVIKLRRQPATLEIGALAFALDAGHGGDNNGALGSTGAKEKDVNLATTLHLKRLLEKKGARVVLTRQDDSNPRMLDRIRTAIDSSADILISLHSNSIGLTTNPEDTKGAGTFYKYICYRPLSQFILENVLETGLSSLGNVGSFNFALNSPTEVPNVLVEMAFISNPEDEMKLMDDEFRQELAQRIVDGVEEFLDSCDE